VRLVYAPRFFRRLEEIRARIARDNPAAASRVVPTIRQAARKLADAPGLGRPGRVPGSRELIVSGTPSIVPYRARRDAIEIITILHGAQRWPERLP
jgi:plasmid stabilization system protein ParE